MHRLLSRFVNRTSEPRRVAAAATPRATAPRTSAHIDRSYSPRGRSLNEAAHKQPR
jgi:hypothetical protein